MPGDWRRTYTHDLPNTLPNAGRAAKKYSQVYLVSERPLTIYTRPSAARTFQADSHWLRQLLFKQAVPVKIFEHHGREQTFLPLPQIRISGPDDFKVAQNLVP